MLALEKKHPDLVVEDFLLPALHRGSIHSLTFLSSKREILLPRFKSAGGYRVLNLVNPRGAKIPVQVTKEILKDGTEIHASLKLGCLPVSVLDADFDAAVERAGSFKNTHPGSRITTIALRIPEELVEHFVKSGLADAHPEKKALDLKVSRETWKKANNFSAFAMFSRYLGYYTRFVNEEFSKEIFLRRISHVNPKIVYDNAALVKQIFDAVDARREPNEISRMVLKAFNLAANEGPLPKSAKTEAENLIAVLKQVSWLSRKMALASVDDKKLIESDKKR
ncbi:MAG: hypothetical protein V1817_01490 [Candidatus Micrarchaeota archaeon]